MHLDELIHLQAVRPIGKSNLDSPATAATPHPPAATASTVYIDCHLDPTTQMTVVMWDDIRLAFEDALHIRYHNRVVPFLRGADLMPLQPLRIAAMPDVTLDIVVDVPLTRTEPASATVGRNPAYGLIEAAMQNYSHIDNPAFGPQPRAPQYIPSFDDGHSSHHESTDILASTHEQPSAISPLIDIKPPRAPQDHTDAVCCVKDISPIVVKATLGDINSQVELGNMYKVGDGIEQDYEAARYWYLKAANQGDASAQCSVGDLYRLGLGTDFDHSTALSWYQKAASQGDASGQYNLGLMFEYGLAVGMDYMTAMDWYRKSADQGHAFAQSFIGDLYYRGRGVPKDYSKAMEWYLLAAEQDLSRGYNNLGLMYLYGLGVAKDKDVASEWLWKATSHKDTDAWAQFCMGFIYFEGLGAPQDYSKAREWLQKSARQGLPKAQYLIAYLFLKGYGVTQDHSEAMKWFRKAADQHLPGAQCAIGDMYLLGLGVLKDYSLAKVWYTKAARQEIPIAKKALEELQQIMDKEGEEEKWEEVEERKEMGNDTQQLTVEKEMESKKKPTSSKFKFW
ncbi:hypothetical protein BGX24_003451 [Mortierella sp. AD032]|nr:hypothetical protein BGX24_003451 [Mortierella sp. AD032]